MHQLRTGNVRVPARALLLAAAACLLIAAPVAARTLQSSTTAVALKLTTHPPAASRSATAKFAWKATGTNATVTCRLGSAAFARCSRGRTVSGLKAGPHSFSVKLVSGRTTRSTTYRWTVDLTAPTAPSVTGGSTTWVNHDVTLSASGSTDVGTGLASYQHRTSTNGGATWSAAATGNTLTASATAITWVQFRALDRAGNASAWAPAVPGDPASVAQIDRTAPTAPTVTSPAASAAASITVSSNADSTDAGGSGLAGYELRTNTGSGWGGPAAGTSVTITAAAGATVSEQVEFRASDTAGNASEWSAPLSVLLDRTAPAITVASDHTGWTNAATVAVSATATDGGAGVDAASWTYRTSTNCSTWTTGSGPSVNVTAAGTTYVEFAVKDTVANQAAYAPSSGCPTGAGVVQIDRTAPSAPTGLTGGSTAWKTAPVTLTASGGADTGGSGLTTAKYVYRISADNGVTWTQAAAAPVVDSTEGTTIVQVATQDAAGNLSAWYPSTAGSANTVKLDPEAPPVPAVSGGSATWTKTAPVTITATVPTDKGPSGWNRDEYETSANGTTWSSVTTGQSVALSASGRTYVRFRAVDNAGNASAWSTPDGATPPGAATASIDQTPPLITVTGGSSAWQNVTSVTVKASATDALSKVNTAKYAWRSSPNGGATWPGSGTGTSAVISAEGDTEVEFQAVDNAGNAVWSAPVHVLLDRTAPTVPVPSGGGSGWFNAAAVPVTVTATSSTDAGSGLDHYQHRTALNGGSFTAAQTGASVAVSAPGTTIVEFRAVDALGNTSAWSASTSAPGTVNIDVTAPTAPTVTGGSASWSTAAAKTIKASGSSDATAGTGVAYSGIAGYEYETSPSGNAGTWSAPTAGSSAVISAEGTTYVRFLAVDRAGNVSAPGPANATDGQVMLDRTPPSVPSVLAPPLSNGCASPGSTVLAFGNDSGSGIHGYNYQLNGVAGSTSYGTVQLPSPGTYTITFETVDAMGWISAPSAPLTITVC